MMFHKQNAQAKIQTALFRALFIMVFALCLSGDHSKLFAQDGYQPPQDIIPAQQGDVFYMESQFDYNSETHTPLRLTPDKSEILTFDQNITRIIVGNQTHMNILLDSPRRAVVIPRAPGATFFVILGPDGRVLMQRHAIVANPKEEYIRIRQTCYSDDCRQMRMFYCPGMCHEISIPTSGGTAGSGRVSASTDSDREDRPPRRIDEDEEGDIDVPPPL